MSEDAISASKLYTGDSYGIINNISDTIRFSAFTNASFASALFEENKDSLIDRECQTERLSSVDFEHQILETELFNCFFANERMERKVESKIYAQNLKTLLHQRELSDIFGNGKEVELEKEKVILDIKKTEEEERNLIELRNLWGVEVKRTEMDKLRVFDEEVKVLEDEINNLKSLIALIEIPRESKNEMQDASLNPINKYVFLINIYKYIAEYIVTRMPPFFNLEVSRYTADLWETQRCAIAEAQKRRKQSFEAACIDLDRTDLKRVKKRMQSRADSRRVALSAISDLIVDSNADEAVDADQLVKDIRKRVTELCSEITQAAEELHVRYKTAREIESQNYGKVIKIVEIEKTVSLRMADEEFNVKNSSQIAALEGERSQSGTEAHIDQIIFRNNTKREAKKIKEVIERMQVDFKLSVNDLPPKLNTFNKMRVAEFQPILNNKEIKSNNRHEDSISSIDEFLSIVTECLSTLHPALKKIPDNIMESQLDLHNELTDFSCWIRRTFIFNFQKLMMSFSTFNLKEITFSKLLLFTGIANRLCKIITMLAQESRALAKIQCELIIQANETFHSTDAGYSFSRDKRWIFILEFLLALCICSLAEVQPTVDSILMRKKLTIEMEKTSKALEGVKCCRIAAKN